MSGSPENQQGHRYYLKTPFDGLRDARKTLIDLRILEGMVKFRDDLEDIYADERDIEASHQTKRNWTKIGRYGLNKQVLSFRRIEWGVGFIEKVELIGSFATLLVSFPLLSLLGLSTIEAGALSAAFSLIVFMIDTGLPYGKVIMNHIGHQEITPRSSAEVVKFQASWNYGVISSPICFTGILIVGILANRDGRAYDIGLNIIRRYARWKG